MYQLALIFFILGSVMGARANVEECRYLLFRYLYPNELEFNSSSGSYFSRDGKHRFFLYEYSQFEKRAKEEKAKEIAKEGPKSLDDNAEPIGFHLHLNHRFQALFSTTGFRSYSDFQTARDKNDKTKELAVAVDSNQIEIAIQAKPEVRELVQKWGVLNIYQVGDSNGDVNSNRRIVVEASHASLTPGAYRSAVPPGWRPKVGIIQLPPAANRKNPVRVENYGSDAWILAAADYQPRLTFTLGDSIDHAKFAKKGDDVLAWIPKDWEQMYIPWEYRGLMVPAAAYAWEQGFTNVRVSPILWDEIGASLKTQYPQLKISNSYGSPYIEAQVWGPVRKIKAFEYSGEPPTGQFREWLEKNRIEIRKRN